MFGVERIGQYDVTPMKDGKYAVSLNNGNIGACVVDAAHVEKMRKDYAELPQEEKDRIAQNVKTPQIFERQPKTDQFQFTGSETDQNIKNPKNNKNKLIAVLTIAGLTILAIAGFVLTRGNSKVNKNVLEESLNNAKKTAEEVVETASQKVSKPEVTAQVEEVVETASQKIAKPEVTAQVEEVVETASQKVAKPEVTAQVEEVVETAANKTKQEAEEVLADVSSKGKEAATELFEKEIPQGKKSAQKLFETTPELKNAEHLSDDFFGAKIPETNKGAYGQDLNDPFDIRNEYDLLSPYYGKRQQ